MRGMNHISHLVDNWIKIALSNGSKQLEIRDYGSIYRLPPSVLEAGFLMDLDLRFCKIDQRQVAERGGVQCRNLRRLALKHVDLRNDEVFDKIVSSCPLIEELMISFCKGLKRIKVTNLGKLKTLYVCCDVLGPRGIEVEAPNLKYFKCDQRNVEKTPRVLNLFPCQNLKCLELAAAGGIGDIFFVDLGTNFPHLEELKIRNCAALEILKFASNSLRLLELEHNYNLEELQVDASKLVLFEYHGNTIPSAVLFTSTSVNWESKIQITPDCSISISIDNPWFISLKAFLTSLISSKIFLKVEGSAAVSLNSARIGIEDGLLLHHGFTIESLSLHFSSESNPMDLLAVIDRFFWVCRPKIIQQFLLCVDHVNFTRRFLHGVLMHSRNQDYPKYLQTDYIKLVKVLSLKTTTGIAGRKPELLDWSKDWSKKTETEWKHEVVDWEAFMKPDYYNCGLARLIHFTLEW